jgi:hypothetical protein
MSQNNRIHRIIFSPKKYVLPSILRRRRLVTETNIVIITENGKKIIV